MNRRFALFALPAMALLVAASPAKRRPAPPAPPAAVAMADVERVTIATDAGAIVLELDGKHAPVTVRNFLRYADQRRFDGIVFYRAMRLAWGDQPNGLIQAGTQNDPRRVLPPIAHEPTSQTGVLHKAGTISMARWAPGTATGDFSILLSDMEGLDADPASADPERQAGYAAFGRVVEGMDVVRRIWEAPLSPTRGEGVLQGQMLETPVRVVSVRRTPAPQPAPTAPASPASP